MVLKIDSELPSLDGATEWIQEQITENDLLGNLIVVHFWAMSCSICKSNFPAFREMIETYKQHGTQSVSVHMPRFEFDTDINDVIKAIEEIGLTGPCVIDNKHIIGDRFGVTAWPSYFLFDRKLRLRSRATGNLGIKLAKNSLERLIGLE